MRKITVKKANCKNCYKCIKNCHVKSIKYENDKIVIIEDECISCGRCITTCPQNAKSIDNDVYKIKQFIEDADSKVCVSIAPSYIAAYDNKNKKLVAALKGLGIDYVEETSVGAAYVTDAYRKLIADGEMENIITTSCTAVNEYIKKYYPELVKYMAKVMSPMVVHGKLIKEKYGENTKVVFIGPCFAKLQEADENSQYIDAAITFLDLNRWLQVEGIILDNLSDMPFDTESTYSRVYPIVDGITNDLMNSYDGKKGTEKIERYDMVSISGLPNVKNMLEEMKKGIVKHCFVEANACYGGCIHGPFMPKANYSHYKYRIDIKNYADKAKDKLVKSDIDIGTSFEPDPVNLNMPTESEIRYILAQIGKYSKAQELNCGSCGYPTCREKAIAVYQNKADLYLCMPYVMDINQTMANVTLSLTPNYIIAVDENMNIKEFNVAAQRLFKTSRTEALNKKLSEFIDASDFQNVIYNQMGIYDKKVKYDKLNIVTEQTIVYSSDRNMAIGIIKDITQEEITKESAHQKRLDSLEMAQKVIDKQMVVAQQIASLLGETTAETKVTLNKLKNMMDSEDNSE